MNQPPDFDLARERGNTVPPSLGGLHMVCRNRKWWLELHVSDKLVDARREVVSLKLVDATRTLRSVPVEAGASLSGRVDASARGLLGKLKGDK